MKHDSAYCPCLKSTSPLWTRRWRQERQSCARTVLKDSRSTTSTEAKQLTSILTSPSDRSVGARRSAASASGSSVPATRASAPPATAHGSATLAQTIVWKEKRGARTVGPLYDGVDAVGERAELAPLADRCHQLPLRDLARLLRSPQPPQLSPLCANPRQTEGGRLPRPGGGRRTARRWWRRRSPAASRPPRTRSAPRAQPAAAASAPPPRRPSR